MNDITVKYSTVNARQSSKSQFPLRIIFIDYRFLGTYESNNLKTSREILQSIASGGYDGPLISVFQKSSDNIFNRVSQPSNKYGVIGVADGHHRLEAFTTLDQQGLLKERLIPVQLIPAHDQNIIRIHTLGKNKKLLTVQDVEACFKDPKKLIPRDALQFQTRLKNGKWVRLREAQPNVVVARDDLLLSNLLQSNG